MSRTTYVAAWHASAIRILFEGPFGQAYYLGERFIRQTRGVADPDIPHSSLSVIRVVDDLQDGLELDLLMIGEDSDRYHDPGDFTAFLHTRVMVPLTPSVARAMPEVAAAAAAVGASGAPGGGAPAVASIPRFPVIPTEIVYMRPDGVIEQIPLEHNEERDSRLAFTPGVE